MTTELNLLPCSSARDWKLFEKVPEMLHGDLPNFLPPFPGSVARIRKQSYPFHQHGQIFPFIALRDGKPVGRIAAIINETHNRHHNDRVGFFGFFDFVNEIEVARKLFAVVETIIVRHGRESMRGPHNPTQNDECGLLVDGFDKQPFVMMTYNPQYYLRIYEELGLKKARDLYAYHIEDETAVMERTARIVERVKKKTNITFRTVDMKNLQSEMEIVAYLFNATLGEEWGIMPVTIADLAFTVKDLKPILDPEMVLFAEVEGQPVGVSLVLPNVNEFMSRAKSSRGILRMLKLAWYVMTQRPREARLALLGVLPEFRAKGIGPVFFFETLARGVSRYEGGEISYVQDINEEIHRIAKTMGVNIYKTYRIYEKTIDSAG